VNPSAENLAKYFYDNLTSQLTALPPGAKLKDVVIWETDTAMARYNP
jgi:6-pyruvoyltetrahydropterin/6-carboxytetrahydropterin synthase